MIKVVYTTITEDLYKSTSQIYLAMLPKTLQEKNLKFLRWQDRAANLFGKILLIKVLQDFGFNHEALNEIYYDKNHRPYIPGDVDFNISHSGRYVVCAAGEGVRLGIDIEELKPINFNNFENVMTSYQWDIIKKSIDPMKSFYQYWTSKESAIKADGRGLSIPLNNIHIYDNTIEFDNKIWYLKQLSIDKKYSTTVATNFKSISTETTFKNFSILHEKK